MTPFAHPIVNGEIEATVECAGALYGNGVYLCTGTLISESWVLTSASCASQAPNRFVLGVDAATSPLSFAIDLTVPHPSWSDFLPDYDFALLRLAFPVRHVAPCTLADGSTGTTPSEGMTVLHVGYGVSSYPPGAGEEIRRSSSNLIVDEGFLTFTCDTSIAGPCVGDAGAPAFALLDNLLLIVGVCSVSLEPCDQYVIDGVVAAVAAGFIHPVIQANPPVGVFQDSFETGDSRMWSATTGATLSNHS